MTNEFFKCYKMWPKHIILTIIRGDEEEFRRLLKNETENDSGLTNYPDLDFNEADVKQVIYEAGAFLDYRFCASLLHIATVTDNVKFLKLLIEAGCDINACNRYKETVLHLAISNENIKIVELLVEKGANVKSAFNSSDKIRNESLTKFLLGHGADPNYQDDNGRSPLHHVAKIHNLTIARMMLANGANVNKYDKFGFTPLHLATSHSNISLIELLLSKGANVYIKASHGDTPLMIAIRKYVDNYDIIKLFLEKIKSNKAIFDGSTALSLALSNCDCRTIKLLLNYGACIKKNNRENYTELHYAAKNRHIDVIKYWLDKSIDVNARSIDNLTPLHIAIREGSYEGCKLLLSRGANVNCTGGHSHTPLCFAIKFKNYKVIRDLLKYGAKVYPEYVRTSQDVTARNILIEHIAKSAFLNTSDSNIESEAIKEDDGMYRYYKNCMKELWEMKIRKVYKNLSLFNILIEKAMTSRYARNENLIEELDSAHYQLHHDFPIYYFFLKEDFDEEIKKQRLINGAAIVLSEILKFHDPFHLAIFEILSYLSEDDIIRINETK